MRIRRGLGGISLLTICFAISVSALPAQDEERAVGWIRSVEIRPADKRAKITQRGTRSALDAQPGEFLFSGDKLDSGEGVATFYYCPEQNSAENALYQLHGTIELGQSGALRSGISKLSSLHAAKPCLLPTLERQPDVITLSPRDLRVKQFSAQQLAASVANLSSDQRQPLEALIGRLDDPNIRLATAVLLEQRGLLDEAAWEYFQFAASWPQQSRLLKHIQRLLEAPTGTRALKPVPRDISQTSSTSETSSTPHVYALVVGISRYEQAPVVKNLSYASKDAELFAQYLRSDRGGKAQVILLRDAEATEGAIRINYLELKRKAGRNDTMWLFVAAHGAMLPLDDKLPLNQRMPSIITHRADHEDVGINSFPLKEAEEWMLGKKAPFGHVRVFLDICQAGYFATFGTGPGGPAAFGILATNADEKAVAYENKIFDEQVAPPKDPPGHGVFTYFLLRGLNTDEARAPGDTYIRASRLSRYVQNSVAQVTNDQQSPVPILSTSGNETIADSNKTGLQLVDSHGKEIKRIALKDLLIPNEDLQAGLRGKAKATKQGQSAPVKQPPQDGPADVQEMIDLEDRGEQVLLDYLKGDEIPQSREEFYKGEQIFNAALQLQPGSPYLSARASFCHGRFLVFEKNYPDAVEALERSIRLEPRAAYAYNALGIAYLERAEYPAAENAFLDAIDRAPLWVYPRHNLALTHWQQGRYDRAIADYRAAMTLAPRQYFYLPYNLGLLYASLNRKQLAEEMYRLAIDRAPARAEPLTGLAGLEAEHGNNRQAKRYLELALCLGRQTKTAVEAASHNYALVLAKRRETFDQALYYWKQNGDYLPSQFSTARALARNGDIDRAIDQYRHILTLVPKSVAARLELIELMESARSPAADRIMVLEDGLCENPRNAVLLERLGRQYIADGQTGKASTAFQAALDNTNDPAATSRLRKALAKLKTGNTR